MPTLIRLRLVLWVLAVAAVSCSTMTREETGSTLELFNGRDLRGWVAVSGPSGGEGGVVGTGSVWSVREGMIVCRGEPIGYLHTRSHFKDFRMTVEYRWAPGGEPGNSGLFSRIDGEPRALPRCVEVQLMHGNAGDVLGLQGRRIDSEQPRHFHIAAHPLAGDIDGVRKEVAGEAEAGRWNRVEILAQGDSYTVWLNGVLVNRVTGVEVVSGPVGLQSEGGEIHFREVRIVAL
jgi:hypothetical protein